MNISAPFIQRPVATSLLTAGLLLAGALAYRMLPVASLPEVTYPVIQVNAQLPGASPDTMATAVATPLERMFGRIAGINQMTSTSQLGSTNVILQFALSRDIDGAARDVQAAINAARGQLPPDLPTNPTWRKSNPAESAIMILALTSDTATQQQMYDMADSILSQKISQVSGVGQVTIGGSSQPAVRVEVNPLQLSDLGVSLDQVRAALGQANANIPKGSLSNVRRRMVLNDNDQLFIAKQYEPLIVAYHNGAPVRLSDVATVVDGQLNRLNAGTVNGKPSVLLGIYRQPDANTIATVDRVRALLPFLQASIPPSIRISVSQDRTTTIRASVRDIEVTLAISVLLVILVVFAFLRSVWATAIPSIAVPLSLVGTFGVMYLAGYTIDNLSLMALTISTGFVVDDAIVVIENITRYLEKGMAPLDAALEGSHEIGFTVLSMSTSLIAVFIPILLMGGIVGRMFREFAITLSAAVAISMVVSLTTTPMMCARLLKSKKEGGRHGRLYEASERAFQALHDAYASQPAMGPRASALGVRSFPGDGLFGGLPLCDRSQGILPGAGYGALERRRPGPRGYLLPVHAPEDDAIRGHRAEGSGRGYRGRLRLPAEYGQPQHHSEAALGTNGQRRPGDQPFAAPVGPRSRRQPLPAGGAGRANRRAHGQQRIPIHIAGR